MKKQWESPTLENLNAKLTNEISTYALYKHYYLCNTCGDQQILTTSNPNQSFGQSFPCGLCDGQYEFTGVASSNHGMSS